VVRRVCPERAARHRRCFNVDAQLVVKRRQSLAAARFDIPVPHDIELSVFGGPTISPDGRQIVFTATVGGNRRLLVRSLESAIPMGLAGTEGALSPFWSPATLDTSRGEFRHSVVGFLSDELRRASYYVASR
jgi:WD40 repeat protein